MINKDPQSSLFSSRRRGAFEIALLYLLIGILWILFSDEAAAALAPNQAALTQISIYKGWGYVLVTALLLYWMIGLYTKRLSRAEWTLGESEKNYQELLQQASDGIFIADAQGQYTFVNEEACRLLGYTKEELLSMNLREVIAPEDIQKTPPRLDELRNGKTLITERKLLRKDGSRIVCEISAKLLKDGSYQSIVRDITERKVTDEALLRSEQRYRSLFENMTNGFARCQMLYDENGAPKDFIYLDVNQAFENLTGLKNVLGKHVSTVIPGIREANPELFEIYGRVALTGKPEKFETYVPGLGSGIWFSSSVYSTEKNFFVAVFEVITERKQAEAALRENEERLRLSLHAANQGLYDLNVQTGNAIVNREYAEMLGYDFDSFVETNAAWIERLHPDDRELTANAYADYIKGLTPEYRVEFRQKTKAGDWKWILSLGKVAEYDAAGKPLRMLGTHTDITERKQAEEKLKASEFRFRLAAESLTDVIYEWDIKEKVDWFGDVDALMGYAPGTFPRTLTGWAALLHPDDREHVLAAIDTQLKGGDAYNIEYRVATINGEWRWWSARGVALRDPHGEPYHWIGSISDITERKQAEEKIFDSELRYRRLFESAKDGILILDAETGLIVDVNPFLMTLLGYPYEYFLGKQLWELGFFKDIVANAENFQELLEKKYIRYEDLPLETTNGKRINVEFVSNVYLVDHHKVIQCNIRDITERKQAEEVLRESEEKFKYVFDHSIVGKSLTLPTGEINPNQALCDLLGYTLPEFKNKKWQEITHPDDIELTQREIDQIISGKRDSTRFIKRFIHKDGSVVWVDLSSSIRRDADGKSLYLMSSVIDISERKQAEALQTQLAAIVDSSDDAIIGKTLEGVITSWNAGAERLYGYSAKEVIGQPISLLIPSDRQDELPKILAQLKRGESIKHFETERQRKDGTRLFVSLTISPIKHALGQITGASTIARNITERKRAEEALHASEERLNGIIASAMDAIISVDSEKLIVLFNAAAEEMFGCLASEVLGKSLERFMPERFRVAHRAHISNFGETGVTSRAMNALGVVFGQRATGEEFPIEASISQIEVDKKKLYTVILRDITERKRTEEELRRSNAELEQFAYVASHDLQEPLRAVAGMVQLLGQRYQGKLDERADEYIGHAVEASTRMQKLINDLLDYSRVNRLDRAFENVAVERSLNTALANLQVVIQESQAQITHDPLPTLIADSGQLTQVLQNLIGNAIKFRGVGPLHIHLGAKKIEQAWQFEVSDNGIGIEPKYYERIFLVFQRLHTRREYPGTGIGLALCKKIIERHHGQIWVESQPGLGSTFYFTIPERQL